MASTDERDVVPAAVASDLERRIGQGEFAGGNRLPSELALARSYGTTRARIRTALASLARRGLVAAHPGTGWFVIAGRQSQTVGEVLTFSQWAAANGREFGGQVVCRERACAGAREAGVLGIGLGQEVLRWTRVRRVDGRPVMIERSVWGPQVLDVIEALSDDVPSVYGALHAAGIRAFLGDHRIEAVAATREDSRLLGLRRSSPLLQVTRTAATRDGQVIEFAADRYMSDFVTFDVRAGDLVRAMQPSRL